MKKNCMKFNLYFVFLISCLIMLNCEVQRQIFANNWTVDCDRNKNQLNILHNRLNRVLSNVELYTRVDNVESKLTGWIIQQDKDILSIKASKPVEVNWEFSLRENDINVRTSNDETFITALAPATRKRFPARIADPDNMLLHETGKDNDYTGVTQIEKYYVPAKNPQIMYLSLGEIASPDLYSLFDKDSNIVIQFPEQSELKRWTEDNSIIQVRIPVGKNNNLLHLIRNYYTEVLSMPNYVPYDDTYHDTAPTGWNHWLAFFRQVTEQDIVDHADFISEELKPYGMTHCQLDDGYDHPSRRLWNKNWDPEKFPHGPEWLAQYIKSKGLIPGLWTVPYCYSVADANPDWFLHDDEGNILMDYQGGGELDFTRGDVIQEYWIPLWQEFKRQGWQYYKFDMGNTSWMWHTYQHNFFDTSRTSYDVSYETMTIYREIMGPEIWHTNHPDIYGGRMGFIDVAGCGKDPGPGWNKMNNFLEVISNNAFQNHIVWYSDPDCIVLRGKPTRADAGYFNDEFYIRNEEFLTFEEARTCASLLGLSGMQFLSGDDLINLEKDRIDLIKKTIPVLPIYPVDLFGRSRYREHYPEIMDLKINAASGVYDVIAVTNWTNQKTTRNILINNELCLKPDDEYLIFDNWREQFIGLFKSDFQADLPAHGTRVFTIRRKLDHPQLLATNRHITSAFSIQKKYWDEAEKKLSGISETVHGATYSLFFYVPVEFLIETVDVEADNITYILNDDRLLTVSFRGQESPVKWSLGFKD
jgi:hypothetical protein